MVAFHLLNLALLQLCALSANVTLMTIYGFPEGDWRNDFQSSILANRQSYARIQGLRSSHEAYTSAKATVLNLFQAQEGLISADCINRRRGHAGHWIKMGIALATLLKTEPGDWVFFLDFDAVITNMSISIIHLIEQAGTDKDIIFAHHPTARRIRTPKDSCTTIPMGRQYALRPNGGVFLVHNTPRGRQFLIDWMCLQDGDPKSFKYLWPSMNKRGVDQPTLWETLENSYCDLLHIFPQQKLNAHIEMAAQPEAYQWQQGDFVAHNYDCSTQIPCQSRLQAVIDYAEQQTA